MRELVHMGARALLYIAEDKNGEFSYYSTPPPSSNAFVKVTPMREPFWHGGEQQPSKIAIAHFHCNIRCVKTSNPAFIPLLLKVPLFDLTWYVFIL